MGSVFGCLLPWRSCLASTWSLISSPLCPTGSRGLQLGSPRGSVLGEDAREGDHTETMPLPDAGHTPQTWPMQDQTRLPRKLTTTFVILTAPRQRGGMNRPGAPV